MLHHLQVSRLKDLPSGMNSIMLHPPIEMKHIDPGIVLENMFQVHTQDNIVTEQQDLCFGIPFMQPFCPCDKKNSFPGSGNSINNPMSFTNFPGIILLLAIKNDKIKTLLSIYFCQGLSKEYN